VILPDTVTSTRYVEFDAPYLKESFAKAGLSTSQFTVQNALGSDATQFSDAQTAITKGATVLIVEPLGLGRRRAHRVLRQVQGRGGDRLRPADSGR